MNELAILACAALVHVEILARQTWIRKKQHIYERVARGRKMGGGLCSETISHLVGFFRF